jgi:hypothetical protein
MDASNSVLWYLLLVLLFFPSALFNLPSSLFVIFSSCTRNIEAQLPIASYFEVPSCTHVDLAALYPAMFITNAALTATVVASHAPPTSFAQGDGNGDDNGDDDGGDGDDEAGSTATERNATTPLPRLASLAAHSTFDLLTAPVRAQPVSSSAVSSGKNLGHHKGQPEGPLKTSRPKAEPMVAAGMKPTQPQSKSSLNNAARVPAPAPKLAAVAAAPSHKRLAPVKAPPPATTIASSGTA